MTQTETQSTAVRTQKTWEEQLVVVAISAMPEIPEKDRAPVSDDILRMLAKRRLIREVRGLNHWQDHARQRVERLLRLIALRRRQDIGLYLERTMAQALAIAHEASGNLVEAEELVGDANLRLWRGELGKEEYLKWVAARGRARRTFQEESPEHSDLNFDEPRLEHDC